MRSLDEFSDEDLLAEIIDRNQTILWSVGDIEIHSDDSKSYKSDCSELTFGVGKDNTALLIISNDVCEKLIDKSWIGGHYRSSQSRYIEK